MKLYHATTTEAAQALCTQGADPAKVGTLGGLQAGWGFYAAPSLESVEYWQDRIGGLDTILTVTLPETARIATETDVDILDRDAVREWLRRAGLTILTADGQVDGDASAAALRAHFGCPDVAYLAYGWLQIGAYLQAQGYDGYVSQSGFAGTVVILNFDLLSAAAFSN